MTRHSIYCRHCGRLLSFLLPWGAAVKFLFRRVQANGWVAGPAGKAGFLCDGCQGKEGVM